MTRTVYVGWDQREHDAYLTCVRSLLRHASGPIHEKALVSAQLREDGILWRPVDHRADGTMFDVLSKHPQSTDFATSRFLVPFLHRSGWALFVDCDTVFLADVEQLFELADPRFAVMVVKHDYSPTPGPKMDGQVQSVYSRKNWSSVMLINCDHMAWHRLTLAQVNQYPGELLHKFFWLRDSEIGSLPDRWNWLVNERPKPDDVGLAHFTLGGKWLPGWKGAPHDDIWLAARDA